MKKGFKGLIDIIYTGNGIDKKNIKSHRNTHNIPIHGDKKSK